MSTDDPHWPKCHLKSQIILHSCLHHDVIVLKLRCRRSCHRASRTCAVMVRRRPFFQEDPLIMFLTLGLYVMPPDKVDVEPCFVVAALIGRAQAQDFMRNGESTIKPYLPVPTPSHNPTSLQIPPEELCLRTLNLRTLVPKYMPISV